MMMLPRARRVELLIPIMYRCSGDDHWSQSKIMNISETGVLFGPTDLRAGAPVEVILAPPVQVGSLAPGKQVCVARVVRVTESGTAAARFEECRFLLEA
jgi:hypothetical protein